MSNSNNHSRFQDESTDCAICLEPLYDNINDHSNDDDKVLTLSCGHKWHLDCLVQQLQNAQSLTTTSSSRLILTGCQCAKCGQVCEHPALEHLTRATDALRQQLDVLLQEQVQWEDPERWNRAASQPEARDALLQEARRKYAFYRCRQCLEPYFGGTITCAVEARSDNVDNDQEPRLCPACAPQQICRHPLQHGPFLVWKCRYCCRPSTHVCYGTVHFCHDCHERHSQAVRQRQSSHDSLSAIACLGAPTCRFPKPHGQSHHINGSSHECEQVYSCAFCESNDQAEQQQQEEQGSHNLLVNPSGQEGLRGWRQLNPQMSWQVEACESDLGDGTTTNFVSSYQQCRMVQAVPISPLLVWPSSNDDVSTPIRFELSARYRGRTDCSSVFCLEAILVNQQITREPHTGRQQRIILDRKSTPTLEAPPDYWELARLELSLDPAQLPPEENGDLFLYVIVRGQDQRFWQGLFGSKVAHVSARILGSPEYLDRILVPAARDVAAAQGNEPVVVRGNLGERPPPLPNQRRANVDRSNQHGSKRIVWDVLVPALCFLVLAWWMGNE